MATSARRPAFLIRCNSPFSITSSAFRFSGTRRIERRLLPIEGIADERVPAVLDRQRADSRHAVHAACCQKSSPGTCCGKALLRVLGRQTLAASSGLMALAEAPAWKPDLMLIDLAMPSIDGCELARQLRSPADFASVPLVAVSGYVDTKHRKQAADAGFDDFLSKPYTLVDLQSLLSRGHSLIAQSRLRVEQTRAIAAATRALNNRSRSGFGGS